eukprot:4801557-Pleurochrysis_carterae.AAC.7
MLLLPGVHLMLSAACRNCYMPSTRSQARSRVRHWHAVASLLAYLVACSDTLHYLPQLYGIMRIVVRSKWGLLAARLVWRNVINNPRRSKRSRFSMLLVSIDSTGCKRHGPATLSAHVAVHAIVIFRGTMLSNKHLIHLRRVCGIGLWPVLRFMSCLATSGRQSDARCRA